MSEIGDTNGFRPTRTDRSADDLLLRPLVPTTRRSIVPLAVLTIPLVGALYAVLASQHPVYGQTPLGIAILTLLTMATYAYVAFAPNADLLDPMRVVSFYYLVLFCVAPLAGLEVSWHFTRPYPELVPGAAAFAGVGYLILVIGYHLPIYPKLPPSIPSRHDRYDPTLSTVIAAMFFTVGFLSWCALVVMAGGIDGLVYSDRARGQFFLGFGYFFWGALFMFSGATLYWASRCVGHAKTPWLHALPLLMAFFCFLTLQGRMRALNFVILGLFVAHYLIKPLRPLRLGIYGSVGGFLALFVGVARAPSVRAEAFTNPIGTLQLIFENFGEFSRVFLHSDLSRLRQVALILDKVPAWMPYDWGESYMMIWNPWMRLIGLTEFGGIEGIGPRLFRLANPDFGFLPTGYLPSFVGEALVNFPWYMAWIVFLPYGMGLRLLYQWMIVRRGDFIAVAIFSIVLLQSANILLQSMGHVVFELIVILSPFIVVQIVARRHSKTSHRETLDDLAVPG